MHQEMAGVVRALRLAVNRRLDLPHPQADSEVLAGLLTMVEAEHLLTPADSTPEDSDSEDSDSFELDAFQLDVFQLDAVEIGLLSAVLAPDVDAGIAAIYGHLRGMPGPSRISVGLALELVGLATMSPEAVSYLGGSGRLRRHGLIEITDNRPWLFRELMVPERVLSHVLGVADVDPVLEQLTVHPVPLRLEATDRLARAVEAGAPLVWIRSPLGTAGLSLAAGALVQLELPYRCFDLRRAPTGEAFTALLQEIIREAALVGQVLVIAGAERLGAEGAASLALVDTSPVPILAVGNGAWDPTWSARYPLSIDAPVLDPSARDQAWAILGASEVQGGLTGLRLAPESIVQTADYARWLAISADVPLSDSVVRQAARRVGGSATVTRPLSGRRHGFADLVLPDHVGATLHRLVGWARHRDEVLERGTLLQSGSKGSGLTAMFTGSPGTGKTLAAHVIADELGIDLVQVDLSAIVDKYIGETEKNLERVFHQAESLNVVLFFDEADALFGRRSEVKDSHDRHANQEVAYLLQRMENFDGLTILATNLRGNLDPAFSRRMSFIVHFPDPDPPTRKRLWEAHLERLGSLDADDPLDLDLLAQSIELSGGDIRNIVLAAGYDAAAAGQTPGMRHVLDAAIGEYHKLGRRIPADGFRPQQVD